eukprot:TRINITY_DN839_c0_g2_i1.p1 TRINITY_DN839_c0_g2~~TRINITY_DN839_c0_g2_i1.p1  ORF type:complete len:583 (-),score=149.51 TRINITY_DN839_c0_g2_i1:38-1681(-)
MNKDGIAWRSKGGQGVTVVGSDVRSGEWKRVSRLFQLKLSVKGGVSYKFDGFKEQDGEFMNDFFQKHFKIELTEANVSTKGWNWGKAEFDDNNSAVSFKVDGEVAFDLPLSEVLQCHAASKNSHEAVMKFHQDDTAAQADTQSLVEMRFFFPSGGEGENNGDSTGNFVANVLKGADTTSASGKGILSFEQVPTLVPRGRYDIEMFGSFLEMHGKSFDYKIKYTSIVRLFQLPRPDRASVVFVISLEPPIRQGQAVYPHVVMQIEEKSESSPTPNISEEMKNDPRMKQVATMKTDPVWQNLARAFRYLTGKKITPPRSFKTSNGGRGLKCSLRANEGFLFPLEKDFFFIHKPPTHIRHEEIIQVEFLRMNDTTNRTFDIQFDLDSGQVLPFKSISRDDYSPLFNFLIEKGIKIKDYDGLSSMSSIVAEEKGKKEERKAKRGTNTEVRLKVARAMQAEEIESDESDVDFGDEKDEDESGSDDSDVDSSEIDSASDEIIDAVKKSKKDKATDDTKNKNQKRKRDDNEEGEEPKTKKPKIEAEVEEGEVSD